MAQIELMLQLIKDNKIVGYEYHINGFIYYFDKLLTDEEMENTVKHEQIHWFKVSHDSVELGVKVGSGWYFDGDRGIIAVNNILRMVTLCFNGSKFYFLVNSKFSHTYDFDKYRYKFKKTGTIHLS